METTVPDYFNLDKRTPEQRQTDHDKVTRYFEHLSPEKRQLSLEWYTMLVDIEEGRLTSTIRFDGKEFFFTKMPWMLPYWKEGLRFLKEVMLAKGEITDES
jgi:hypothetical protein